MLNVPLATKANTRPIKALLCFVWGCRYLSDHINRHYIHELNQIGQPPRCPAALRVIYPYRGRVPHFAAPTLAAGTDTQSLIDLYEDAISTHALTGGANAEAPFPAEHKWQVLIEAKRDELSLVQEDTVATCGISGKCFRRYWVQFLAAKRYYFRNKWNYIDVLNYFIFVVAVYLKLQCYILAPSVRDSISTLAQAGQIDKFVDVYAIGLQMALSNYIVAFNAVLTWVKIFKHLEFHSMIHVFTRTISTAAKTLGVFMFVFTIVVAGSAHGFCMAFGQVRPFRTLSAATLGALALTCSHKQASSQREPFEKKAFLVCPDVFALGRSCSRAVLASCALTRCPSQDIEDFSGLAVSIMSTLRMAVGDFDYDAMYRSQRFLGPVLFWVFIFLVFFVLVSMFIALLSDAYDKAKDDAAHGSESESIWEARAHDDPKKPRRRRSIARHRLARKQHSWPPLGLARNGMGECDSVRRASDESLPVALAAGRAGKRRRPPGRVEEQDTRAHDWNQGPLRPRPIR